MIAESLVFALLLTLFTAAFKSFPPHPPKSATLLTEQNYMISALEHAVYMRKSANDVIDCYKKLHNSLVFGATQQRIDELEAELTDSLRRHSSNSHEFTKRVKKVSSVVKLRVRV